jgi:ADP-heptose:LPS heptosyltransferase
MTPSEPPLLVLRASGLGDLLTVVPAIRAIRDHWPERHLILAIPAWLERLALQADLADAVARTPNLEAPVIRGLKGNVAFDLHGCGPQSHRWLLGSEPGELIAFRHREVPASAGGPRWQSGLVEHERERWCRLLRHFGFEADPDRVAIRPPPDPLRGRPRTVVHPGAKDGARRWPEARWSTVVRGLLARGLQPVITGSVSERSLAERVAERAGAEPGCVLAGQVDVSGLAGIVAGAELVCCGDTGVAHLATAFARPSIVLFGPSAPTEWGPLARPEHAALWPPGPPGDPHGIEPNPQLLRITPADVLDAVDRFLVTGSPSGDGSVARPGSGGFAQGR